MEGFDLKYTLIGTLWAVCGAGLAWYCFRAAVQIQYVTLADGRRQERRIPMAFRLLLPLTPNLTRFFTRPSFEKTRRKLSRSLVSSGLEGLLNPEEFMAIRTLAPVVFGPVWFLLIHVSLGRLPGALGNLFAERLMLFDVIALMMVYVHPSMWLRSAVKSRHRSIERSLPFVLDLLTLSVEAGLDFMTAIQRIVQRRKIDPLGEELIRTFREVQLGKTRREALRSLGSRVNQTDVSSVVNALVQADELGVSIGSILRIQADQMRTRRFQRAEKAANEAPVKMLFPLTAFIFPSVFIVLLGPVIMEFLKHGF